MGANVYLTMSESGFKHESDADSNRGSTVEFEQGAIEVLDYGFGLEQKGTEEGGRPRSVESVTRSTFRFKKAADARTPVLFELCAKGDYLAWAEVRVYGAENKPYLTYYMTYVHVSKFSPSGGEDLSVEEVELTYGQMKVTFDFAGIGAESRGSVSKTWSWVMEMPAGIPALPSF